MSNHLLNIAIAVDQGFNALFFGSPDETLSSRAYRGAVLAKKPKKKWKVLYKTINKMFFWQADHCKQAYESEVKRRQYPAAFSNL